MVAAEEGQAAKVWFWKKVLCKSLPPIENRK